MIKKKMESGKTVFGTWCMLPSSFNVDVIARTGIDFIVLDMEHGALTLETVEDMVRAAQLHGCQPIINYYGPPANGIVQSNNWWESGEDLPAGRIYDSKENIK